MVKHRWRTILIRWGVSLFLLAICAFGAVSWYVAGKMVEPERKPIGQAPYDLFAEDVSFESASGNRIGGWFIPAENSKATVILLHGMRGTRRTMVWRARFLRDAEYSTLMIDLQAHGESDGDQITVGYKEKDDVAAAVDYIRARKPSHKIAIIGWSLGGAAALLAMPLEIDALVVEACFPTITEAVHNRMEQKVGALHHIWVPVLLAQLKPRMGISARDLEPIEKLDEVACPLLVMSGSEDPFTTLGETKRLFARAREPKELCVVSGAGHVDLYRWDGDLYKQRILKFLNGSLKSE